MPSLFARAFELGLEGSAALARGRLAPLVQPLMRLFARGTLLLRGQPGGEDVRALAEGWQRLMPSRRAFPIAAVEERTAFTEIHARCPLTGSGDLAACHRLMEYDRALVRSLGGQLVVLESRAQPGVQRCRLAIRRAGESVEDLVPAHLRQRT